MATRKRGLGRGRRRVRRTETGELGRLSRLQTSRGVNRRNQSIINVVAARAAQGPGRATTRGGRAIQRALGLGGAGGGGGGGGGGGVPGLILPTAVRPGRDSS